MHNKIVLVILSIIGTTLLVYGTNLLTSKADQLQQEIGQNTATTPVPAGDTAAVAPATTTTVPSTTGSTSIPAATPVVVVSTPTPIPLASLHLSATDYSHEDPQPVTQSVKFTVFSSAKQQLATQTVASGQYTDFKLAVGSYFVTAETATLTGSATVALESPSGQYFISLNAKPITVKGTYYLDENNNGSFDSNEKTFANKEIYLYYQTKYPSRVLTAGSTRTDGSGNFSLTVNNKWEGEYILGAEQVREYYMTEQPRFQVVGGQTYNQNFKLQSSL